jgi:hypothetical protein
MNSAGITTGRRTSGKVRAAANSDGKIVGYEYHGWQHHWITVETTDQLAFGTAAAERPELALRALIHDAGLPCTRSRI